MRGLVAAVLLVACSGKTDGPITFGTLGPLAGDAGKGSWRFGVATAATQIEDNDLNSDWWYWTAPTAMGGLGKDTFIANASDGFTMDMADVGLVAGLNVDSYRFSIEWSRVEPTQGVIDETAIQHYRDELTALAAMGIRPVVTIHHFSNPVWVADPRASSCPGGPSATNLCGLADPVGAPMVIQAMADHAGLVAKRFGDLVDEWGTVNEPINYLLAAYGLSVFPPGITTIEDLSTFIPIVRNYIAAHAAMYKAIKANDTVDADGDGNPASVGFSISVADWEPSRSNKPSTNPDDVAARDRLVYLFHYVFVDSVVNGTFDPALDMSASEPHPEWLGTIDWLGLQYYFRAGVTADRAVLGPPVNFTPCFNGFDFGSCLPAPDPTYCVPQMGYEGWTDGIHDILTAFHARYPALPLVVSEGGIATDNGTRRAENIVRNLESIARARDEGVDVRGYYHWSLTDNFEWASGFAPHFGLFSVDYTSYARTPTEGADVFTAIAKAREVTSAQRDQYGGTGPMSPEPGAGSDPFCPGP